MTRKQNSASVEANRERVGHDSKVVGHDREPPKPANSPITPSKPFGETNSPFIGPVSLRRKQVEVRVK